MVVAPFYNHHPVPHQFPQVPAVEGSSSSATEPFANAMLWWQVESQQPLQHQEEAMVVEEELQLRWQRGREGWWRKQWTRPHFNESAPRFRDRKQEARMLNCHRRVMCEAAKKSLKEKKLHIGP